MVFSQVKEVFQEWEERENGVEGFWRRKFFQVEGLVKVWSLEDVQYVLVWLEFREAGGGQR